jgi:hypothetical protein
MDALWRNNRPRAKNLSPLRGNGRAGFIRCGWRDSAMNNRYANADPQALTALVNYDQDLRKRGCTTAQLRHGRNRFARTEFA